MQQSFAHNVLIHNGPAPSLLLMLLHTASPALFPTTLDQDHKMLELPHVGQELTSNPVGTIHRITENRGLRPGGADARPGGFTL